MIEYHESSLSKVAKLMGAFHVIFKITRVFPYKLNYEIEGLTPFGSIVTDVVQVNRMKPYFDSSVLVNKINKLISLST